MSHSHKQSYCARLMRNFPILGACAAIALLFGCSENGEKKSSPEFSSSETQIDSDKGSPTNIVTIGGAATEIVFALGAGDQVAAVDLSSTFPPEVRQLPQVGYVRSISPEGVLSKDPGLIIATGALGPPAAREIMEELSIPTLWLPDPKTVEDLERSVSEVAQQLGKPEEGEALLKTIQSQLSQAESEARSWSREKPTVLFFLNPPTASTGGMAGGSDSRSATLIELAGGTNAAKEFSGFQPVSLESVIQMNPDVIICGISPGHGASPETIQALRDNPALSSVSAIQNEAVYGVPLDDLTFGPRLGEAALRWNQILSEQANPPAGNQLAQREP
ncbi:iron complex transport system substrate-binding protein [Puniceicoccus vermicola]|uniref:ABC transporter substrate-binding protein n=2 Tax=Puniceicoccus vermicola TaxID=388746 RepID=A0A7X1AYY6_9BACT|nr:ABC transporter substrate-binding protein [Puniceicoccus vermicola]MBC2601513.1 ABC transporter substrate-binding protein [Puniceicoccus vermicola]